MIKLEHVVLASPEQMEFIIEGMRNPMNSWEKSDSEYETAGYDIVGFNLGTNDHSLMQRLANAGTDHRKFMRMMPVYVRITAPLYWWKEFDTYKVGTVANSCSTMHKIQEKEFTLEDFSCEHLLGGLNHYDERKVPYLDFSPLRDDSCTYSPAGILECCIIPMLNLCREKYLECDKALKSNSTYGIYPEKSINNIKELQKQYWWQMIQLLPSSYNQTRNVMLNYEVLANIYKSRRGHKLDEWREFCKWIETLPYSELICGSDILRKKFNIPEETIDKSIGNPNPLSKEELNALANVLPNIAREAAVLKPINNKDLVEVTRCKNCQFYISKENMKKDDLYKDYVSKLTHADGFCVSGGVFTNEDDFCSCADR